MSIQALQPWYSAYPGQDLWCCCCAKPCLVARALSQSLIVFTASNFLNSTNVTTTLFFGFYSLPRIWRRRFCWRDRTAKLTLLRWRKGSKTWVYMPGQVHFKNSTNNFNLTLNKFSRQQFLPHLSSLSSHTRTKQYLKFCSIYNTISSLTRFVWQDETHFNRLTERQRVAIYTFHHLAGWDHHEISEHVGSPVSTVRSVLTQPLTPRANKVAAYKISTSARKELDPLMEMSPGARRLTYGELKERLGLNCSDTTLRDALCKEGFRRCIAICKPFLTNAHCRARFEFGLTYLH